MYKTNLGYIFECKKDEKGVIGIKESFSYSLRNDVQKISAVFGVDINGNILCPSYYDKSLGLSYLGSLVSADTLGSDVERFVRSNRATYSLSSATYLICELSAKVVKSTHSWEEVKVNFYVPKASSSLEKLGINSKEWGIVCDIASSSGKINTFKVGDGVLNGYKQAVLAQLNGMTVDDKVSYIVGRLIKYI